jgi:hypothetical protein
MAITLSAFLFAVFKMNVFQALPHFALGAVMGLIAWRSGSVLPAIVLHFVYNGLVYELFLETSARPAALAPFLDAGDKLSPLALYLGAVSAALAVGFLVGMTLLRRRPDAVEAFAVDQEKEPVRARTTFFASPAAMQKQKPHDG